MGLNNAYQPSFAAGEVSPSLYGRVDLAKYHSGLALCRNFFIHPHGGASNRAGSQFVGKGRVADSPVVLIPFSYSSVQTYMLEFGDFYMRPIYRGGYIVETEELITAATNAFPVVMTVANHGYSPGDDIYIDGVEGMTEVNGRTFMLGAVTTDTFELDGVDGTAFGVFTGCVGGTTIPDGSAPGTGGGSSGSSSGDTATDGGNSGTGSGGGGYTGTEDPPPSTKPGGRKNEFVNI